MLFTFPSRYLSTIGLPEVFSLAGWSRLFQSGFLVSRPTQDTDSIIPIYTYGTFTPSGHTFQICSASYVVYLCQSFYPGTAKTAPVWAFPRSIATTKGITFVLFSSRYYDVSVPGVRFLTVTSGYHAFNVMGCPIRKSADVTDICSSPQLIAACHVLPRLWEPRHPPCALIYFLELISNNLLANMSMNFSEFGVLSD